MSAFDPGADGALHDPRRAVVEALADLAALVRGGGRPGSSPEELADSFAAAVGQLLSDQALVIDLRDDGLFMGGEPFWAHDLLARRVCSDLQAQGLRALALQPDARPKALRGLALILTRDWSKRGPGELRSLLSGRRLPGVDLDFDEGSAGGGLPTLEPRSALEALRAGAGEDHPHLGPVIDRLRQELARGPGLAAAVQGTGAETRARLQAEIATIGADDDVSSADIGRVAFEAMRLDSSGLQAADTFRLVIDHYEQLLSTGRTADALALLRPCLTLVDPQLLPDWPHRPLILGELGGLFHPEALDRLVEAANQTRQDPAWSPLLLSLGRVCPDEHQLPLCEAAGRLGSKDARQAVADGLVLGTERPHETLALLLAQVQGVGAAVVLQAMSRLETPKLLEKILARMDSDQVIVREAALVALRKHRTPHTQERIRQALADEAESVRTEALRYLTVYRDTGAAPLILQRLQTAPPGGISTTEARALGLAYAHIAQQAGIQPLSQVAREAAAKRPRAALAAIIGLQKLGPDGRAALAALGRSDPDIRRMLRDGEGGAA